jgi:hypothetical protein
MSESATPGVLGPLPDMIPGSQIETEWNFFRREWPRLLAEGREGQWVLIKGEEIAGFYDTADEAITAGHARFGVVPLLAIAGPANPALLPAHPCGELLAMPTLTFSVGADAVFQRHSGLSDEENHVE